MKFAYADPPYLGCALKLYGDAYYDSVQSHIQLVEALCSEYDGWAYSLSSTTLHTLLPIFPSDVRVMAWVKPFASFKPNVNPAYAWEPVIVRGGRPYTREAPTIRDWHSANITLERGLTGAKPESFCRWLLDVLNAQDGDEFHDLFPGTGVFARVRAQQRLDLATRFHLDPFGEVLNQVLASPAAEKEKA